MVEFEKSNNLGRKEDDEGSAAKIMKYVLGSKKDLKPQKKVLDEDDLKDLQALDENDSISLQEVSALTNYGVKEVFDAILTEVVSQKDD